MNKKSIFLLFWLAASIARASDWYVSTNGVYAHGGGSVTNPWALQCTLTNTAIQPGDTVWLHSGIYSPTIPSPSFTNENEWLLGQNGSAYSNPTNWVTFRSASNEWAKIDGTWLDTWQPASTNGLPQWGYDQFRDLEFYDSHKGYHAYINGSYPSGPWSLWNNQHTKGMEFINCVVHDVGNCFGGNMVIRGCIIWHVGLNHYEHVCYPGVPVFSGNIVGWTVNDVMEHQNSDLIMSSNIVFGSGQTATNQAGLETLFGGHNIQFDHNYYYNFFPPPGPPLNYPSPITFGGDATNAVCTNNVIVLPYPTAFTGVYSNTLVENNLFFMNAIATNGSQPYNFFAVSGSTNDAGQTINNNHYYIYPSIWTSFILRQYNGATRINQTWDEWRSNNPNFDTTSTTNYGVPTNMVFVIPNQDQTKRCNIAVYNFLTNNNVTVSLSVLNQGDSYQLYNAQDYGRGAIQSGTYNGIGISVPMTNLTTAPILSGTNWRLFQPPPLSPTFGAFVVIGSSAFPPAPPKDLKILSPP